MAEEFHAGICGRNWWDSMKTVFLAAPNSSPCSMELNDIRSNGCPTGLVDMKARSGNNALNSDSASGDAIFLVDSTVRTMGFSLSSSSTSDWNQTLLRGGDGRGDTTLDSITGTKLNYDHQETSGFGEQENCSILKAEDLVFLMDQTVPSSTNCSSNIATTCQGLSMVFPVGTSSNGYSSMLLQSLFESDPQPKQFLVNNRTSNCSGAASDTTNSNDLSSSRPRFQPHQHSSSQGQLQPTGFQYSNSIGPSWNASAAALHDFQSGIFPSLKLKPYPVSTLEGKPKCRNLTTKLNSREVVQDSELVEKKNDSYEPLFKRPRSEVPSPLPTFKVRKEKLSDRITALQQLVSPFGKTDTASVLHEATEYIKFLHDQVNVLSTAYMQIGDPDQYQQVSEELKDENENKRQDLRSRGLCLVPIPSTYAFADGHALDFWSPTFGGTFR